MRISPPTLASRLKATVQASAESSMVLVTAEFATQFRSIPTDGRTNMVQDPKRNWVYHLTYPDGKYESWDTKIPRAVAPGLAITFRGKQVQYLGHKNKKQPRIAAAISEGATIKRQTDSPPEVCLIDINRVIKICGFKKSFIYEQPGFPEPIRLGTSRRSSVRWIESEIVQWVNELVAKRSMSPAVK